MKTDNLQTAVRFTDARLQDTRKQKWLDWHSLLNAHTNLTEIWSHIRRATGKARPRALPYPAPQEESDRLALLFKDRAANSQLPAATQRKQEDLVQHRHNTVERTCQEGSDSDADLTVEELQAVESSGKDTAPCEDQITYTMIKKTVGKA